jgi:hypothetical protein
MDPVSGALISAAAALATGAYLNARFSIGTDLQQLQGDREWVARLIDRIRAMGDTCSLYGIFDRVDPGLEALWFEGRSWSYGELKNCKSVTTILPCTNKNQTPSALQHS